MQPNKILFSDNDITELSQLIAERDGVDIVCDRQMSGIWLTGGEETELRLLLLANYRITVSRVCFQNKRHGTMTAVLGWMKSFCERHEIGEIVIQSVETKEMASWCLKNEFEPNPYASLWVEEGFLAGDYKLML